MIKVIVASKNPVKIQATSIGFKKSFGNELIECLGQQIKSGVSDQPMSDEETYKGALNRAKNSRTLYTEADYWIGIEGGIATQNEDLMAFAWVVILDKNKKGRARSASFFLPPKVSKLVKEGIELGVADDMVFGAKNSQQKGGAIGLLTHNLIDRKELYIDAVIMALIPFLRNELY